MTKIFGMLSVAGMAVGANAATSIDLLVSSDGGATWSNNVAVLPGSVVRCAIFVSTDAFGFAGATIQSLTGAGTAGDSAAFAAGSFTGRVAPFNFGSATNAIFAQANGFRIDASSDAGNSNTAAGLTFAQRDPSSGGLANYALGSSPAMAFAFDVTVGAGFDRDIVMTLGALVRGVANVHTSSSATRGTSVQDVTLDGASIRVVPTPATLALVGLGGLVIGRRRR